MKFKFSIKIWDKNNGDVNVYDNQYGSSDQGTLTTAIAGGSIIIHNPTGTPTARTSGTSDITNISIAKPNSLQEEGKKFNIKILHNPTNTTFKLFVESNSDETISICLTDVSGRVIGVINKIIRNETVTVGNNFIGGTYFAEVVQGTNRKVVKLVKTN